MRTILFILFASSSCFSQKTSEDFIIYSNYANEAEYYFHEGCYDTSAMYFEAAFSYSSEQHPTHQKLYAYSLMQVKERKKAINVLKQMWVYDKIDTVWFPGLTPVEQRTIIRKRSQLAMRHESIHFYNGFIDSIMQRDQNVRRAIDTISDQGLISAMITTQDKANSDAVIQFTRMHGFPAGKNAGWNQTAATFLIHMPPEWFVENYALLIAEVQKGNIEPWMLARGIDRMYAIEINGEKINPYNRYWTESIIDPFLMFQNCAALGVSPYYDFNWRTKPRKTKHFEYYKLNKQYFNATLFYTHNND